MDQPSYTENCLQYTSLATKRMVIDKVIGHLFALDTGIVVVRRCR